MPIDCERILDQDREIFDTRTNESSLPGIQRPYLERLSQRLSRLILAGAFFASAGCVSAPKAAEASRLPTLFPDQQSAQQVAGSVDSKPASTPSNDASQTVEPNTSVSGPALKGFDNPADRQVITNALAEVQRMATPIQVGDLNAVISKKDYPHIPKGTKFTDFFRTNYAPELAILTRKGYSLDIILATVGRPVDALNSVDTIENISDVNCELACALQKAGSPKGYIHIDLANIQKLGYPPDGYQAVVSATIFKESRANAFLILTQSLAEMDRLRRERMWENWTHAEELVYYWRQKAIANSLSFDLSFLDDAKTEEAFIGNKVD